jgi:predicted RND superfamily exporter protein
LVPTVDGFAARRLVEDGEIASDLPSLSERALRDPLWIGKLISPDGRSGLMTVQPVDSQSSTDLLVVEAIEGALLQHENEGFEFYIRGDAVELVENGRSLARSTARLTPFTVLVIVGVLLLLSRSWTQTLSAMVAMGTAVLWTVGLMGWLDWPRDAIHEVLLPLILVVGTCDTMHLLSRHADEPTWARSRRTTPRLVGCAKEIGTACLMTSLTTAGAFLSFTTSTLQTFVRFGLISSFGVMACLVLTFTLLPLLLASLPAAGTAAGSATSNWHRGLDALMEATERRSGWIVVSAGMVTLFFAFGWALHLRVDTDWNESLGEHSPIVRATRFLERNFGRSQSLEIALTLPAGVSIEQPDALSTISNFSKSLSRIEGLDSATSLIDLLSRVNLALHDDDPAFDRPAATAAANAELLELLSIGDADLVGAWISLDRSQVRVSVETSEQPYSAGLLILKGVDGVVQKELPTGWSALVSGEVAMNRDWIRDVQRTQFLSFPTAAAIVFLLIALFLRSISLACVALIPTLLPVVVTLGAMGWLGMGLDVGRAMIAAVLLGIGVDDAIHVLARYKVERSRGDTPAAAISVAMRETGRPVVTTSLALSLGFLTLMASAWQTISSFGFFVSLAILGALASTLLVLPALIFAFAQRGLDVVGE